MSRLGNLVSKGVRLIVTDKGADAGDASGQELPPDAFAEGESAQPAAETPRSEVPADVADFAAVYAEAGVELPGHGYGVDKVAEMLESKRLASLQRDVKAAAVLAALEAAGVVIKDVIQDAVRRDRALDAFETAKGQELADARAAAESRIATIKDEIDAFLRAKNEEMEGLKSALESAQRAFVELQGRKRREEDRLYEVVAHFLEGSPNPVSTGSSASAPVGAPTAGEPKAH